MTETVEVPRALVQVAQRAHRVVVLTGAGMSAESGLATFRDPENGLWQRFSPQHLASAEGWEDDPELVWAWYLWRFERAHDVRPNAGHVAIAQWGERVDLSVVTQNVDNLHERAGTSGVVHLHGSISAFRCSACAQPSAETPDLPAAPVQRLAPPRCARCDGLIRPGVVWFGETLPEQAWADAVARVSEADLVLVVGTSGIVYPAAGLPAIARSEGAAVVEINPVPTDISDLADLTWRETAARALPTLVDAVHGGGSP